MQFLVTTAIRKILKMRKHIRVIPGGTSAGKTFGILPVLIDKAARESGLEISVVSESIPHLRKGALKDFLKIMKATGRYVDSHYNRTLLTYTFANGSFIEFFSVDIEGKVRGPRRNILYINEANNITFETYHQLAIRTSGEIYIDFNPSHPFWVHEELKEGEDVEWLTLTYKDNEALDKSIIREIEKAKEKAKTSNYWANWWKVYGLGQLGSLEGVVFSNWSTIDKVPENARMIGYGLDFGYSVDPTSCVAAYEYNGELIFDEVLYETGLTNPEIADRLIQAGVKKHHFGYADSAEPKSIRELQLRGMMISSTKKGSDSIRYGIDILQQRPFKVTSSSVNLIKELRSYVWEVDREGNKTGKPVGKADHAIDAMRYLALMKLAKREEFYIGR